MDCPALESVQVTTVCADFLEKSCCKQQSHWRIFRWGSGQGQSWSYLCLRKIADSDGEEGLELGVRTRLESKEALSALQCPGDRWPGLNSGSGHGDGERERNMRDSSGEHWLGHGDETGGTQMAHQRMSSWFTWMAGRWGHQYSTDVSDC